MTVVYSNDCPSELKRVTADSISVWQCDGTADQVQINDAINAVAATGQTSSHVPTGGGGSVLLVGYNFNLSAPVVIQSWVDLGGVFGRAGTILNAASGFSGTAMIQTGQTYTEVATVHDLRTIGSGSGTEHSFYMDGQITQTPFTYSDPRMTIRDCWFDQAGGGGIVTLTSNRSTLINDCMITRSNGWGIDGSGLVDSIIKGVNMEGCGTAGSSGGVYIGSTSTTWTACRIYNSHGYGIQSDAARTILDGCAAIDSSFHNFYISAGKVSINGCQSDSAGLGNTNTYDGFHIGTGSGVTGITGYGNESYDRNGTPHQRYGVYLDGSPTYGTFQCVTYGNATGSKGGSAAGTGFTLTVQGDSGGN